MAVLLPTWLGDIVMATPALARLRAALPAARITAITPPGMDVVLRGLPVVDAIVTVAGKGLAGPWRTAATIRNASRAAVVLLPNSFRSAMAARLARCRVRIGTDRDGRGLLLTHRVGPATSGRGGHDGNDARDARGGHGARNGRGRRAMLPVPAVMQYDHVIATAIGAAPADPSRGGGAALRPRLVVDAADAAAASACLGASDDGAPLLVVVPGGNREAKRWPAERFAAIARDLRDAHGLRPVVSGSPGERDLCRSIAAAIGPPVVDLAAAGASLAAVKGVIARARLVISNDTGPRHLAAGLGTPCIALFGPTDSRWTTLPEVPETILMAEPFLPEHLMADRHADLCRIDRIPVSDVRHAAERRLSSTSDAAIPEVAPPVAPATDVRDPARAIDPGSDDDPDRRTESPRRHGDEA